MKTPTMIILDLDNTLLRSDKTISSYTLSVLEKCRDKGIKVVFATGRAAQATSRITALFPPDVLISYGGALATVGEKIIHHSGIPTGISFALIQECLLSPEVLWINAANEEVALSNFPHTNDLEDYPQASDFAAYQDCDFSKNHNVSFLKIHIHVTSQKVIEDIASRYPMCNMLKYTGEDLYRFANINATKWDAVKAVAEYYSISTNALIAFGDDINDFDMIKNCGIGVAVANAIDDVKTAANYICDTCDNDGVAKWLEEYT